MTYKSYSYIFLANSLHDASEFKVHILSLNLNKGPAHSFSEKSTTHALEEFSKGPLFYYNMFLCIPCSNCLSSA